jgi:hypothetical protein
MAAFDVLNFKFIPAAKSKLIKIVFIATSKLRKNRKVLHEF